MNKGKPYETSFTVEKLLCEFVLIRVHSWLNGGSRQERSETHLDRGR